MKYRDKSQREREDVQLEERQILFRSLSIKKRAWFEDGKVTAYHLHPQDLTTIQII